MKTSCILQEVNHPRSRNVMRAFGRWCGIDGDVTSAAVENIFSGSVTGMLVSGAQASGKDTVCPLVIEQAGLTTEHCRVAHAIRSEIDLAIKVMREAPTPQSAVIEVAKCLTVPHESARIYVNLLFTDAQQDPLFSADIRTASMRRVLQHHGAEARMNLPGYWVKIAYRTVFRHLAEGRNVHLTDGRFLTEIDAGRVSGLFCVRLFVPVEVRVDRIRTRDGIVPDLETLNHPGETAADGYWGVDLEVANIYPLDEVTRVILPRFATHRERTVKV